MRSSLTARQSATDDTNPMFPRGASAKSRRGGTKKTNRKPLVDSSSIEPQVSASQRSRGSARQPSVSSSAKSSTKSRGGVGITGIGGGKINNPSTTSDKENQAKNQGNLIPSDAVKISATQSQEASSSTSTAASSTPLRHDDRRRGIYSIRRSLRETVTPPAKKRNPSKSHIPTSAPPSSLAISFFPINADEPPPVVEATSFQNPSEGGSENYSESNLQLPKTPNSILKDQLEMTLDESLLLSPSQPISSCRHSLESVAENSVPGPPVPLQKKSTASPAFDLRVKARGSHAEENVSMTATTVETHSPTHDKISATESCSTEFAERKPWNDPEFEVKSTVQKQSGPLVTGTFSKTPYETPYIQENKSSDKNQKQISASTVTSTKETPLKERGSGVYLDLTAMFSNHDQTTVRKSNKPGNEKLMGKKLNSIAATPIAVVVPSEDEWAELQCETFANWLNYILQPNEDSEFDGSVSQESQRSQGDENAYPLRTLILHQRMAKARAEALALYSSQEMQSIHAAIQAEISKGRISIRKDRDMYADLTLRKRILSLLMSYSMPWLRLGLETLYGETILPSVPSQLSPMKKMCTHQVKSKQALAHLRSALKTFVVERVLSDSNVLAKYTKQGCKVLSGVFEKRYQAEMRSLVLKRLLTLIFFLDRARRANILDKAPRLFAKLAPVKASREVLLTLSRDFLEKEGDITKHLSRIGLKVFYQQEKIDEIEMIIQNFAVDLRDGIRLAQMAEILTSATTKTLMSRLRIPAVSRLQKLHNVGVAISALRDFGVPIPDDIASHHIVDGHRALVLKLMWCIIGSSCFPSLLDVDKIQREIVSLEFEHQRRGSRKEIALPDAGMYPNLESIDSSDEDCRRALLLRWSQAVCSLYDLDIENLSSSFADGQGVCVLLHHYHPKLLSLQEIKKPTTKDLQTKAKRGIHLDNARANERANSALANSRMAALGGIPRMVPITDSSIPPDEKSMIVYLSYACSRLLSSREEVEACVKIQSRYRRYLNHIMTKRKKSAASVICRFWRKQKSYYFSFQRAKYFSAVRTIEDFVTSKYDRLQQIKAARIARIRRLNAAVVVQARVRGILAKKTIHHRIQRRRAAIILQSQFRQLLAQTTFAKLNLQQKAVNLLQRVWRGFRIRNQVMFLLIRIVKCQALFRGLFVRQLQNKKQKASISIQRIWRGFWDQLQYQITLLDIVFVQSLVRRRLAMMTRQVQTRSVLLLQSCIRRHFAQIELRRRQLEIYRHSVKVEAMIHCQRITRGFLARKLCKQTKSNQQKEGAAVTVQSAVQRWLSCKRCGILRGEQQRRVKKTVYCQSLIRRRLVSRHVSVLKNAAKAIQSQWRRFYARTRYHMIAVRTIKIQAVARGYLERRSLRRRQCSAAALQAQIRRVLAMNNFFRAVAAAITLQRIWRAALVRSLFTRRYAGVKKIQALARGYLARHRASDLQRVFSAVQKTIAFSKYLGLRHSAASGKIQALWRRYCRNIESRSKELALERSAMIVQRAVMCFLCRRALKRSVCATLAIQAQWRSYRLRSQFCAATSIEAAIRGYIARRKAHHVLSMKGIVNSLTNEAKNMGDALSLGVIRVQCLWRAWHTKLDFLRTISQVIGVQAIARGYIARRRHSTQQKSTVILQAFARKFFWHRSYLTCKRGFSLLQARFRGVLQRQKAHQIHKNATMLQAFARGFLARHSQRCLCLSAAIIQRTWRGFFVFAKMRKVWKMVVTLQSLERAAIAQRYCENRRNAILLVQTLARTRLARQRVEGYKALKIQQKLEHEQRLQDAAMTVQSKYRACRALGAYAKARGSVIAIQNLWRGFVARVDFQFEYISVVTCQGIARLWLARREVAVRRKALARVQSVGRTFLSRLLKQKLLKIHSFTVTIQSLYRGYKSRCLYERECAARMIQKSWRCYTIHVEFMAIIISISDLQAYCRSFLERARFRKIKSAAVVVQLFVRMALLRTQFIRQCEMSIEIQRCTRGFQARNNLILKHTSAIQIQKNWRRCADYSSFMVVVLCAIRLQKFVRLIQARKRVIALMYERIRRHEAAGSIQRSIRRYICRLHLCMFQKHMIQLQSLVRGYVARSKLNNMRSLRTRIRQANQKAQKNPQMQLGARTFAALEALQKSQSMAEIMTAVCTLEMSTRYSKACCMEFCRANATEILLRTIRGCNRSLPHVELVYYILRTMTNIARFDSLLPYVTTLDAAEVFLDLLQMFRDKKNFCLTVQLLAKIVRLDDDILSFCKSHESKKRLSAVYGQLARKHGGSHRASSRSYLKPSERARHGVFHDVSKGMATLRHIINALET